MDIFEELENHYFEKLEDYKKNVKGAVNLLAGLSAMSSQMNEMFDKLILIMVNMQNPPLASQQDKARYKDDLDIVIAGLKMQQSIVATSGPAYSQTALELNKLLKEMEAE